MFGGLYYLRQQKLCTLLYFAFSARQIYSKVNAGKKAGFSSQKAFKMYLLCADHPVKIDLLEESLEEHSNIPDL